MVRLREEPSTDNHPCAMIRAMEEFYYPNLRKKEEPKIEEATSQETEEISPEEDTDDEHQEDSPAAEKRSWLKAIYEFAKRALEEEE